jgi:hypothetical protein
MSIILKVWEVYKRDSQQACLFLTEDQARNQDVFKEVDLISESYVSLTQSEIDDLHKRIPVFS